MISASHNPPEYNGIKIFDQNGQKITKNFENKIQKFIEESDQLISFPTKEISLKTNKELMDNYLQSLIQTMGGDNLSGLKIILDTCHGSATIKKFLESFADVRVINNTKDGKNNELVYPPWTIKKSINRNSSRYGVCFDGDADRVIGVDSVGNVLMEIIFFSV